MRRAFPKLAVLALLPAAFPAATLYAQYFPYGKNKVQYEVREWWYVQSEHFDVYYYAGGYALADFTAKTAEDALQRISRLLGHRIESRVPLVVYQGHNDFAVTNVADLPVGAEGVRGVTELLKNRIAIPFMGDYRDFRRVIHHELVHAVLNDMFYGGSLQSLLRRSVALRLPAWFNEGIAEYSAVTWDSESDMWVREAMLENRLADIDRLGGYWAYRGGQGVWDYVAEQYGREKIAEILDKLRGARSVDDAFQQAVGLTVGELSERWHETLREVHYPEITARQRIGDIARPILTRDNAGWYNVSPALSPQGDRIAYLSTTTGLFDVFIATTNDGAIVKKLVEGQTSPQFESLRILSPGLSWSPDGRQIAVAVKSGPSDAVIVVDVETEEAVAFRVPGVDQIHTVAWSPNGEELAFEASVDAQSDIFVLDLATRRSVNLTDDVFSDHEPAWSPDGESVVFHSDRGPHVETGTARAGEYDMHAHDYRQFDLYLLRVGEREAERLTRDETWDEKNVRFGADGNRLLFLSDRTGTYNLYEKNLASGTERPLTDLTVGIHQMALSADGSRAALVGLRDGSMSVYMLPLPFDRTAGDIAPAPNVWAQRVTQVAEAPALAVANAARRQSNPFLRDATDGVPLLRGGDNLPGASLAELSPAADAESDSASIGPLRVDFRNRGPDLRFEDTAVGPRPLVEAPTDNLDKDGNFVPRKYRLRFSPDLVYGAAVFDALYGVQAVTQITFSDLLGNHRIFLATNLLLDLRNSDYLLSYLFLPARVDWGVSVYHTSRLLLDTELRIHRYRWFGAGASVTYPFDTFRRLDLSLSVVGGSRADVTDPARPAQRRTLVHPTLTYTTDLTRPGLMHPRAGRRIALSISGSPVALHGPPTRFLSLLGDARFYQPLLRTGITLAARISGGTSLGPDPQLFFSSGVQNWVNRQIDDVNGFPIDEVNDFVFATPVMPLRGHEINAKNGQNFGLFNAELRFPMYSGPIRFSPFYGLHANLFADAGLIWGNGASIPAAHKDTQPWPSEVLVGAGTGLRTLLLGYPVRVDLAWPYRGLGFGPPVWYFSVGLDF